MNDNEKDNEKDDISLSEGLADLTSNWIIGLIFKGFSFICIFYIPTQVIAIILVPVLTTLFPAAPTEKELCLAETPEVSGTHKVMNNYIEPSGQNMYCEIEDDYGNVIALEGPHHYYGDNSVRFDNRGIPMVKNENGYMIRNNTR
jgi:hypothetical protein